MKVYQILSNDDYQSLVIDDADVELFMEVAADAFTGISLIDRWKPIRCRLSDKTKKASRILMFSAGAFAFHHALREVFFTLFESVGEVLPISVADERWYVLNVTRFVPLDRSKTNPLILNRQWVPRLEGIAFESQSLESESLFCVRECSSRLFCVSGQPDPGKDFYRRCKDLEFKGLEFESVWSGD